MVYQLNLINLNNPFLIIVYFLIAHLLTIQIIQFLFIILVIEIIIISPIIFSINYLLLGLGLF